MKKLLPWVSWFAILLLTACSLPSSGGSQPPVGASTATLSPAQVETQISAMLTLMPTNAGEQAASKASPTPGLPTVSVVTATAEGSPAATEAAAQATDTPPAQEPTATAQSPAAAPTPTATPTVSSGAAGGGQDLPADWNSATGVDHLDNAQHWNWPTGSDQYTLATFANGVQEIETLSEMDGWRIANPSGSGLSNSTVEAVFKTGAECSGNAHYGVMVRVPVLAQPDQGYLFGVTCDGRYSLRRWDGKVQPEGQMWDVIHNSKYFFEGSWITSSAINKGPNQANRLRVDLIGSTFTLYANGVKLTDVQVNQIGGPYFSNGYFGVFVGRGNYMDKFRIQLDEMAYWLR